MLSYIVELSMYNPTISLFTNLTLTLTLIIEFSQPYG